MCVVSFVGDHYDQKWKQPMYTDLLSNINTISRFEFDNLKREVEEMKVLLKGALEYDKKNNEPDCQIEDKIATLKQVAKLLGVELGDIIG